MVPALSYRCVILHEYTSFNGRMGFCFVLFFKRTNKQTKKQPPEDFPSTCATDKTLNEVLRISGKMDSFLTKVTKQKLSRSKIHKIKRLQVHICGYNKAYRFTIEMLRMPHPAKPHLSQPELALDYTFVHRRVFFSLSPAHLIRN